MGIVWADLSHAMQATTCYTATLKLTHSTMILVMISLTAEADLTPALI